MKHFLAQTRTRIAEYRTRQRELRELERQLSHYRTPNELAEIEAMIARSEGDTSDVERILTAQAQRRTMIDARMLSHHR